MLTVQSPAKLNLTIEALGKRTDGFHEIRSVIQTISLVDTLSFQPGESIEFKSNMPGWVAEKSLVSKAVYLLKEVKSIDKGVVIQVKKDIPLVSGLGGDSSDAAAVLRGLNQFWDLGLSQDELVDLAGKLGSDVSFFLYGGTAQVEGRGEIVTRLPPVPHRWVVLLVPPVPRLSGKTRQLYESLTDADYTDGRITRRMVETLSAGREFKLSLLFNAFETPALLNFPGLLASWQGMVRAGAADVHLAGSGPTLFSLFKDRAEAEELFTHLQTLQLESYLAETLNTIEKVA